MAERPGTIEARSRLLLTTVETYRSTESDEELAQLYSNVKEDLSRAASTLLEFTETATAFRENVIEITIPATKAVSSVVDKVEELAAVSVKESLQSQEFSTLRKAVEKLTQSMDVQLRRSWTRYVKANRPSGGATSTIALFERLNLFSQDISTLRDALGVMERIRADQIPTAEEVELFVAAAGAYRHAQANLGSADLPKAVSKFLEIALEDGIPLTELRDDVREWIRQHGVEDQFLVIVS